MLGGERDILSTVQAKWSEKITKTAADSRVLCVNMIIPRVTDRKRAAETLCMLEVLCYGAQSTKTT